MKIIYKTGSLLDAEERWICQGCNAQCVMGSGIAKLIRDRWPKVYDAYRMLYVSQGNMLQLGNTIWVDCGEDRGVINAITQQFYGRDPNVVYVSYEAIRKVIHDINEKAIHQPSVSQYALLDKVVAFPLIGAGLANGSWKIISKIIEEESTNFQPVVYLLDGKIPEN